MSLPESPETAPESAAEALPDLRPGQPGADSHERWSFLRDVLVFQVKLVLGNIHNFIFVPVSLAAAAADMFFKHERHGSRFYKVMEWAKQGDEAIGLYSALEENETASRFSVDAVVARVEDVIVREYARGGTTASVKAAVDRVLDKMQRESPGKFNPEDIVRRAAEKIREKTRGRSGVP
ncbi:MAG TPA: hypothetical protein VHW69_00765 [Rhizomicrobium sp.]|jgi:hypothetical protein|nr:hypothetical protein [Rhizomicrobium sp.]